MASPAAPIRFAIIGTGWRADFYLRLARAMPDRFQVTGVQTRDARRAAGVTAAWGVPTHLALGDLLRDGPELVVVSVPWAVTPMLLRELADRDVPVLSETPPAPDVDGLRALRALADARIQVAEQFQFQPQHAARLAVAASGRLGTVSEAQMSVAHGYHGIDLMRRFLQADDDTPMTIRAMRFISPIVAGPDRSGPPTLERLTSSTQLIAWFDLGDRLGVMDHADEQYFSWIRARRMLVRGDRGEIDGMTLRYLADFATPITLELARRDTGQAGDLEGHHHVGITAGAEWVYRSPFQPADLNSLVRLSDEEIAVGTAVIRMREWLDGGPGICSLAHGAQDHYLTLLMQQAADSGEAIPVRGHVWDS